MYDLSLARIPIIEGINDLPIPPNHLDNGRGGNGAYFISKFHTGISLIEGALNEINSKLGGEEDLSSTTNFDGGFF